MLVQIVLERDTNWHIVLKRNFLSVRVSILEINVLIKNVLPEDLRLNNAVNEVKEH